MNTYNIAYNGVTVLERIPEYALKKHTEMVKGYLYMSGSMTLKDRRARNQGYDERITSKYRCMI